MDKGAAKAERGTPAPRGVTDRQPKNIILLPTLSDNEGMKTQRAFITKETT